MRTALWVGFVAAVILSGGPPIILGAIVAGLVLWAAFWL